MKSFIAAYVEGIRTRKDRTIAITLGTQELSPETAASLLAMSGNLVSAYISDKGISQQEIDDVDKLDVDLPGKSQSQRIRATLYVLFTQSPEGHQNFDDFYHAKTEAIINHLKAKIK